jgi:hypothetical protein
VSDGIQFYATFYNAPPAIKVSGCFVILPGLDIASLRVFFFLSLLSSPSFSLARVTDYCCTCRRYFMR